MNSLYLIPPYIHVSNGSKLVLNLLQKREEEFNQYLRDKMADAKGDFRQLLKETHSLTYK